MIIESFQKRALFEQATREGLLDSNLAGIPDAYRRLLGVRDIGQASWGMPLTQKYTAVAFEPIDVSAIRTFFQNLYRDYRVLDLSLSETALRLEAVATDLWAKTQLAKSRSTHLAKVVEVERMRATLGATWSHVETFSSTANIDLDRTTAHIDVAEGVATLPSSDQADTVHPDDISIQNVVVPKGGSFLGSDPSSAFDGLPTTNWRCSFTGDGFAGCTAVFRNPVPVTSVTVDPIGFGIRCVVEALGRTGRTTVFDEIVYRRTTFPVGIDGVSGLVFSYRVEEKILPKVGGLRDVVVYKSPVSESAVVVTKELRPNLPYTELRVDWDGRFPPDTGVRAEYSTDGITWSPLERGTWFAVRDTLSNSARISAPQFSAATPYGSLWSVPVERVSLSTSEGRLLVGLSQIEVSCFRRDWGESSVSKIPSPEDFEEPIVRTTWVGVPSVDLPNTGTPVLDRIIQPFGSQYYINPFNLTKGSQILAFSRKTVSYPYQDFCLMPRCGDVSKDMTQTGHNYRMRFWVYCSQEFDDESARYWFYQGWRPPGSATFEALARSAGSFSMLVNGETVAAEACPSTLYTDNTSSQPNNRGKPFTIRMQKGWNLVEILLYVYTDDPMANTDPGDPYLQLVLNPSLFDPEYQRSKGITMVVASGERPPVSEFDLQWNLPPSPRFWAWSPSRDSVLFSVKEVQHIDGQLKGGMPACFLDFRGYPSLHSAQSLYLRLSMYREPDSIASLKVDSLKVVVR